MIEIKDKRKCSGCGACAAVCPHNALRMAEDADGFRYPRVDREACTGCGLCDTICPMKDPRHGVPACNECYEPSFYAAQHRETALLKRVSSGGAFWAMACAVLDSSGVVYGAVQENVDHIFHARADSRTAAEAMRRSKYFQSDTGKVFSQVRKDLRDHREVLFSGTPCQVAALNCFLKKDYPNLYTCEVVCHGVPSMLAWRKYREETEQKTGKRIVDLVFRDKSRGWHHNQYRTTFDDGSFSVEASVKHLFHQGYLLGLFYRPSCGTCPFASLPRTADVTLADFWEYRGGLAGNSGDAGVSLIAVNSSQGEKLFGMSAKYLKTEEVPRAQAVSSCRHLCEHPEESCYRGAFLRSLRSDGYHAAAKKWFFRAKLRYAAGKLKRKLKRVRG